MKRAHAAALALAAALLGACATAPQEVAAPGEDFISGRLALRVAAADEARDNTPPQQFSASFELQGSGEQGELRLISPLGTLLAVARWAPGQVSLQTSEGERRFENLEALAAAALGESLPLAALPDWLAGRPWPGAPHKRLAGGLAEGFEQAGWRVDTSAFAQRRIEAMRQAAPQVMLRVRLDGGE